MDLDPLDSVLGTPRNDVDTALEAVAIPADNENDMMVEEDDELQVRTMEVPRWLSTLEVTKHLVGGGKKKVLEEEYPDSSVTITGLGSGTKDPNSPGFGLPHLLVTMSGRDVRQLGRLRRALEDELIDYVLEHTLEQEDSANPPPSLGQLLYGLGLSSANASPKTKDRAPDRSVLARSHFPIYLHTRKDKDQATGDGEKGGGAGQRLITKKVWMNALELPRDADTQEYHGRFLASKSLMNYYRTHFHCRVDIYGVWGDADKAQEQLMCAPYVLITSEEKANVDRCIQYVEHRIREHEEKFEVSRVGGRRVLRGEPKEE